MKKQAEKFFLEKLNGCYKVINKKYPNSIFWFYDKQIIRQKKLCKILGEEKKYKYKLDGELIFEQDLKTKRFWINSEDVWFILGNKFSMNYLQIQDLTMRVLKKYFKSKEYSTELSDSYYEMEEELKTSKYTTKILPTINGNMLDEHLKYSEYTTYFRPVSQITGKWKNLAN